MSTFNRPLSVGGWSEILEFLEREKILLWKSTHEGWMYALCELNPNSKLGILLGTELLNITRISRGKSRVRQALRGLEKDEQEKILEAILAELA